MEQLKIAYFNQLGRKELDQAKIKFEQIYPNIKVKLISTGHDQAFEKLASGDVDLVINDFRGEENGFIKKILLKLESWQLSQEVVIQAAFK